ncbi:hypothetical protein [Halorubrum persicum]|uniref:hypothetical protein n=1 Tax=Halorubrum persicum TaxID=1383844 RepID=UPI001181BF5B|nr:hypothetical protein [Halorubrum persicum]
MLEIDTETVEEARQRGGNAADDRPSRIDNTLVSDTIGFGSGDPLVGSSYNDYPDREDLANPSQGEFLETLFSHELVGSYADAVKEMTGARTEGMMRSWLDSLESAAELHGLSSEDLFADSREELDREGLVSEVLGYEIDGSMLDSNNVLLFSSLYLVGCSTEEIAELLEIRETDVKDRLKSVGLLNGRTTDEQETAFREKRGEVNRPSGGVSVNHKAVSESDSVTVVSR